MVILRSGSVTSYDSSTMSNEMSAEQFALFLIEACKQTDIQKIMKDITTPNRHELADIISAEVHRQIMPMKELLNKKDNEILSLKKTITEQQAKLEDLEQHGRRDSLRVAGVPENTESDDTDAAILDICAAIKVDPPVEPKDIAVSHRVGKTILRKGPRQILVKFATRNVRERVYRAKSALKSVNQNTEEGKPKIYINEDLTKFRAGLARKARSIKNAGLISKTWTIYGKVMIKDDFGHVKIITKYADHLAYKQTAGRGGTAETGEQSTTGEA